ERCGTLNSLFGHIIYGKNKGIEKAKAGIESALAFLISNSLFYFNEQINFPGIPGSIISNGSRNERQLYIFILFCNCSIFLSYSIFIFGIKNLTKCLDNIYGYFLLVIYYQLLYML